MCFKGIKVWWSSNQHLTNRHTISYFPREDEKRIFQLKFHRRDRDLITQSYLKHVLDKGEAIAVRDRKRKLYTNNKSDDHWHGWRSTKWSHVIFKHPSNFKTLAMEPTRKQEIMEELHNFTNSKDYYAKIGKAWKRGYLLHGPPGTGKSSMIAAMANLLQYDVYDLELTAVKDNIDLRKLLIETSCKSIIVIEDIDCSLDLTGQRKKERQKEEIDPIKKQLLKETEKKDNEVTLSGLLNVIDGLWSAIGEERIIVFTTNFIQKLDPALIRKGRMDNHIELSYCCFEAFKNLMPKSGKEKAETCLKRLIEYLETAKEKARTISQIKFALISSPMPTKIYCFFYPYIHITFHEFENEELFDRSKVFVTIERYLSYNSSNNAKRLVAKGLKDSTQGLVLSMDDHEEVTDVFEGINVWWSSNQHPPNRHTISYFPREDEKRFFQLKFHRRDRDRITRDYLKHVLDQGEAIAVRDRKRKLYTNNKSDEWRGRKSTKWSHVVFKHPSTFKTLAMEPTRKQ
nr:AAA-ATPase ASD, mitochondrial-like [Ipomoea batatas]